MTTFNQSLVIGQMGESQIAQWMRSRGWHILPAYEKEIDNGKGPRLFTAHGGQLIAPDLLALRGGRFVWIEAKHKEHFTWYRKEQAFQTGIDKRHFDDYVRVADKTGLEVWVMFLHRSDQTWIEDVRQGAPVKCPTGLFRQRVRTMDACKRYGHQHANGMYYWSVDQLEKIATLAEVNNAQAVAVGHRNGIQEVTHRGIKR